MRRIGTVSRTAQRLAIVYLDDDDTPNIGTMVLDESLSTVDRTVDVFGLVDRSYVAVTADSGSPVRLAGSKLYTR